MKPKRVTLIILGLKGLTCAKESYENIDCMEHIRVRECITIFQINTLASGLFKLVALADDEVWSRTKLGTGAMSLAINYETVEAVD